MKLASFSVAFLLWALPFAAPAQDAQTILHLLDYVGVDYPEAVADGKIRNADEYKEMQEAGVFSVTSFAFDPVPLLGIYPSAEALGAQMLALLLVAADFFAARTARVA